MRIESLEEFQDDVRKSLGRANGNVFHRRDGIEGVHDGQILVRLKRTRFTVLDYSFTPTLEDIQWATGKAYIKIPKGAGQDKCRTPDCSKIGVPVCIYDSQPDEPDPLYLRSGLCFTCQRMLNEKRRTERKRPAGGKGVELDRPSLIYAIGPNNKKFKYKNGESIELASDAVIVNGSMEGVKSYGDGYGFQEIGYDMKALVRDASLDMDQLVNAVSTSTASMDENGLTTSDDVNILYQRTFQSLSKTIFLLTQWKASWDTALAAAHETVTDPSLTDAVTHAATMEGQYNHSSSMATLLLAVDGGSASIKLEDDEEEEDQTAAV